jgi:class 3 adenylate cyclase
MGKDEVHTLELVERDFRSMTNWCQKFEGQVLKTTGDGLLMDLTSAVQAHRKSISDATQNHAL